MVLAPLGQCRASAWLQEGARALGRGPTSLPQGCSPYLSKRRCSVFFMHFRRQQVRKAMDMSRMMAELTMEAITATLKPKVSWGVRAMRGTRAAPGRGSPGPSWRPGPPSVSPIPRGGGEPWLLGWRSVQTIAAGRLSGRLPLEKGCPSRALKGVYESRVAPGRSSTEFRELSVCFHNAPNWQNPPGASGPSLVTLMKAKSKRNAHVWSQRAVATYQPCDLSYGPRTVLSGSELRVFWESKAWDPHSSNTTCSSLQQSRLTSPAPCPSWTLAIQTEDYISQPPLQLHVVTGPCSGQWGMRGRVTRQLLRAFFVLRLTP